jgi:uncharacterized protein
MNIETCWNDSKNVNVRTLSKTRLGAWFQTYTGRQFWPMDPRPGDFDIRDIAHGLANICRFGGHVKQFYAVANHAIFVSHEVPAEDRFDGLMHDSPEAYIGDMVQPFKLFMPAFKRAEKKIWWAMCVQFGCHEELPPSVKHADLVALMTERRDLLGPAPAPWDPAFEAVEPSDRIIEPLSPKAAEVLFLDRFVDLWKNKI